MSIDYSTYVGPYVRCAVGTKESAEERQSCTNIACSNSGLHMTESYCPQCGIQIGPITVRRMSDAVDDGDIRDAIDERLVTASGDAYMDWAKANSSHLWKPNVGDIGRHLEGKEDFYLADITAERVENERVGFEEYFAPELAKLRSAYGEAAVSVRWGVIQYYC